jgi:hypothetical protein
MMRAASLFFRLYNEARVEGSGLYSHPEIMILPMQDGACT